MVQPLLVAAFLAMGLAAASAQTSSAPKAVARSVQEPRKVRVCAAQPRLPMIDWRLKSADVLDQVDKALAHLERIVAKAGEAGCDALALPEDTLGVLHWEAGNRKAIAEVLPQAVSRMLERLGRVAASHQMYLVCATDTSRPDGSYRNAAFFLGRDGREIGRHYKVHPTISESDRARGSGFPVFKTADLGGVGMLICYDLVMPESTRALALAGADVVFVPTMGGAITSGDAELNRAAFRVRAVDNFVYLVVAKRGGGSIIVSPQGKVLAESHEPDGIVIADIDPFGGRAGGDSANVQADMRARLFRERNPAAYGVLTDPNPRVLDTIPATITVEDAVRIWHVMLTTGEQRFQQAETLLKQGKVAEAAAAFEKLRAELPGTWIDRSAAERLARIRAEPPATENPR